VWAVWLLLSFASLPPAVNLAIAILCPLLIIPLVLWGRRRLDANPNPDRAYRVTMDVHYGNGVLLGAALIAAVRLAQQSNQWPLPAPVWIGMMVMLVSGALIVAAVIRLLVKGSGLPFAAVLTRVVVTEWVYSWTRNPMVLAGLAFIVGVGLWLQSGLFLVWVLVVVTPAILVFLELYEERELEARFGQDYLDYKARTPRFWPRPPARLS